MKSIRLALFGFTFLFSIVSGFVGATPLPIKPVSYFVVCTCQVLEPMRDNSYPLVTAKAVKVRSGAWYAIRQKELPQIFFSPWQVLAGNEKGYPTEAEADEVALELSERFYGYRDVFYDGQAPELAPERCFGLDNLHIRDQKPGQPPSRPVEPTPASRLFADATVFLSHFSPDQPPAQYIRLPFESSARELRLQEGVAGPCSIMKTGGSSPYYWGMRGASEAKLKPERRDPSVYINRLPPSERPPSRPVPLADKMLLLNREMR